MPTDLFTPQPKTQKDLIYDWIKSKGRVFTHELNQFGLEHNIGCVQTRARELKAELKIWRVRDDIKMCIAPRSKENLWSCIPGDRDYE